MHISSKSHQCQNADVVIGRPQKLEITFVLEYFVILYRGQWVEQSFVRQRDWTHGATVIKGSRALSPVTTQHECGCDLTVTESS